MLIVLSVVIKHALLHIRGHREYPFRHLQWRYNSCCSSIELIPVQHMIELVLVSGRGRHVRVAAVYRTQEEFSIVLHQHLGRTVSAILRHRH